MIAPLRGPSQRTSGRSRNDRLETARRIVAATLLPRADQDRGPQVAAWRAWLFAGWMAITAIIYGLSMAFSVQ
jgi:hypothetical protein